MYRHGKSGSGVGCACGLIKLIITSVHPNISTRQLHSISSHLLYVILSSQRPMRRSMLCQLFECYSCSFVWFLVLCFPESLYEKYSRRFTCSLLLVVFFYFPPAQTRRYTPLQFWWQLQSFVTLKWTRELFIGWRRETVQPRYKQGRGGDHYDGARGLRSHRLADMYIQHSGTGQKKKEEERLLELFCWLRATKRDKRKEILIGFFPYKMDGLSTLLLSLVSLLFDRIAPFLFSSTDIHVSFFLYPTAGTAHVLT